MPTQDLDPELEDALDDFFARWKGRVRERLVAGERRYRDEWKQLSPEALIAELKEELLDMIAYAVMFSRKESEEPIL